MASSIPDNVVVMPPDVGSYGESIGPVDYGCVRRYRHRRLGTFLWLHGFRDTLRGLLNETDALMSVAHLSQLVQHGLWDDAVSYVSRFLRPASHPQSDEAQVLIHFLKYNSQYLKHDDSVSHDALRIRSIVLSILHSERVRASLDWERVRHKASRIVHDLAYKVPELKDLALFPAGPMMPQDVLPIGFRYRRRRYMKEQDLPGPKTLAKIFLRTKKRLPSSTRSHELNSGLTDRTRKWLVDILDAPVAPVLQTMCGTLPVPAKISGAPVAAISQTVNMTSHAENSGISAVINAGVNDWSWSWLAG